jgi:hypothetical protein
MRRRRGKQRVGEVKLDASYYRSGETDEALIAAGLGGTSTCVAGDPTHIREQLQAKIAAGRIPVEGRPKGRKIDPRQYTLAVFKARCPLGWDKEIWLSRVLGGVRRKWPGCIALALLSNDEGQDLLRLVMVPLDAGFHALRAFQDPPVSRGARETGTAIKIEVPRPRQRVEEPERLRGTIVIDIANEIDDDPEVELIEAGTSRAVDVTPTVLSVADVNHTAADHLDEIKSQLILILCGLFVFRYDNVINLPKTHAGFIVVPGVDIVQSPDASRLLGRVHDPPPRNRVPGDPCPVQAVRRFLFHTEASSPARARRYFERPPGAVLGRTGGPVCPVPYPRC